MMPEKVGRYEIREQLGKGGMATVFRAFDPRFKREVAVKILPRELMFDDPQFRARFEREAETIAKLEHPAIVPVYDFGEEEGQPYLVMRLMTGGSLADLLRVGPISVQETARILDRIGSALDRAHDAGIIHRDLKPGNILFDQYGDAFLADFGIARLTHGGEALTVTGGLVGTPAYMSPEQIQGAQLDGRTDIYALGIIVFEMLTGKKPYEADTPAMMLVKQMTEPVPNALDVMPDLPPGCDTVINKATAKEADQRYGRASEMAETLNTAVRAVPTIKTPAPEPTLPTSDSTKEEPPPPKSSRNLIIGGALVGVLLLAIILFLVFSRSENEPDVQAENLPAAQTESAISVPTEIAQDTAVNTPIQSTAAPANTPETDTPAALNLETIEALHRLGRGRVFAAELSPDGQQLALGSSVGVWIYDAHTLEAPQLLQGHRDIVSSVAWSPDGSQIVSGSWDGTARLWDVATGEQIAIVETNDQLIAVVWSPNGQTIAATTWGSPVTLYNAATSRRIGELEGNTSSITRLRFSPDGQWLAAADNGAEATLYLWDAASGSAIDAVAAHSGEIANITWSPDSTRLLSVGLADSLVRSWDVSANGLAPLFDMAGHEYGAFDAAWSPDGAEIVTVGGDNLLLAWNAENGRSTGTLSDSSTFIRIIPLSDSNQYTLFEDNGRIQLANATNGQTQLVQDEHTDQMRQVAWSPTAFQVATANGDGSIRLWNAATGEQIANWHAHDYGVNTIAWTADSTMIISAGDDGAVRLWDIAAQNMVEEWRHPDGSVLALDVSPDGRNLAMGDSSGAVWLADFTVNDIGQSWQAHSADITQIAWAPDSTTLATSSEDGSVTLWNAETGEEILSLPSQSLVVSDLAWSPDGMQFATTSHDFTIRVWEAATGEEVWQQSHLELASSVAWSPDGRTLASGGWDQTIRLWNAANGDRLGELNGHAAAITSLDWSPDGRALASGSDDGTAIIWGSPE